MCFRKNKYDSLSIALSARIVIDTLVGFFDGEKLWHATEEGIATINEVLMILRNLYSEEKPVRFYHLDTKRFTKYDQMILLKELVEETGWATWEEDLEQWLANKERVLDYFMALESRGLSNHHIGGCF
jgi:hypothetical protein